MSIDVGFNVVEFNAVAFIGDSLAHIDQSRYIDACP